MLMDIHILDTTLWALFAGVEVLLLFALLTRLVKKLVLIQNAIGTRCIQHTNVDLQNSMGLRGWLYALLILALLFVIYWAEEDTYFQWLTLLIMVVLLLVVDIVFFNSSRAFIFDPFYANYQKLNRPSVEY